MLVPGTTVGGNQGLNGREMCEWMSEWVGVCVCCVLCVVCCMLCVVCCVLCVVCCVVCKM